MKATIFEELALSSNSRFSNAMGRLGCRNAILCWNESFAVIPDLHPLNFGHSLLVSRRFSRSILRYGNSVFDSEVQPLLRQAFEKLSNEICFDALLLFEHCAASDSSRIICGTDYGHLHLLPVTVEQLLCIEGYLYGEQSLTGQILPTAPKAEYVYCGVFGKLGQVLKSTFWVQAHTPSQIMRRVVGKAFDVRWDWKMGHSAQSPISLPQCFSYNIPLALN
jgi:hypothetical protein